LATRPPNPTAEEFVRNYSPDQEKQIRAANFEFNATYHPALAEKVRLSGELESLSKLMASRSFMEWLSVQPIPLIVASDESDERSYFL